MSQDSYLAKLYEMLAKASSSAAKARIAEAIAAYRPVKG